MGLMNRLNVCKNSYQGKYRRVLCVCSAGVLRSPTTAWVLSNPPFSFNTRAAGIEDDYALIPVDEVLVNWADEIVVMEPWHKAALDAKFPNHGKVVHVLGVPDTYEYRNKKLAQMIKDRYIKVSAYTEPDLKE